MCRSTVLALGLSMLMVAPLQSQVPVGDQPSTNTASGRLVGEEPQDNAELLTTSAWCRDATTYCWREEGRFAGLRLVFEPQLGVLFQNGNDKFEDANFQSLEKIGLETNLVDAKIGLQAMLIYPSTLKFQGDSPLVEKGFVKDVENGQVRVEVGFAFGVTLLDGILAIGYGWVNYDERDFINTEMIDDSITGAPFVDGFWYFNIQPIAAIKSALKGT